MNIDIDAIINKLNSCPDINHARILPPDERVSEVIVPAALRDKAIELIQRFVKGQQISDDTPVQELVNAARELEARARNVLAAMGMYNEKNGTYLGGAAFIKLGTAIARSAAILNQYFEEVDIYEN